MSLTNEYNNNNLIIQSRDSIEIRPVRSMTCYICFENISTMQKQFGLQNNCDHFFCFDCLSTWRHTVNLLISQQFKPFLISFRVIRRQVDDVHYVVFDRHLLLQVGVVLIIPMTNIS